MELFVERVDSVCWIPPGKKYRSFLGHDLVVVTKADVAGTKPRRDLVFCPSKTADGGAAERQLNTWEMCKVFPSCTILSADAGSLTRAEVECGKEHVVLEVDGGRTVIKGSFGERQIAPYPMKIVPVQRRTRDAHVDC